MNNSILIIDDEAEIRRLTGRILTRLGYQVSEAANGAEGIQKISAEKFALIILDHDMPVMNGSAFLEALRNELKSDIPVLMMSGNTDVELRKKCYALGVFDFIAKPESADIISARVGNGMKIAELLDFHKEMKTEMLLSSEILKGIAPPAEIRRDKFLLQTYSESFVDIGGDISLVFGAETERPVFIIGDITGHGVSAALFAIFLSVAARRAWRETLTPHKILARLNRELAEYLPATYFVSMFCCMYDVNSQVLHYVNAGHPVPSLCHAGKVTVLEGAKHPVLGVVQHQEFRSEMTAFAPGDWLTLFTDGVEEAYGENNTATDETVRRGAGYGKNGAESFALAAEYLRQQRGVTDDRTLMVLSAL